MLTDRDVEDILKQHDKIECIASHYISFPCHFKNFQVMTFFRNPVQRVLSEFFYLQANYKKGLYLNEPRHIYEDIQTWIQHQEDISLQGLKHSACDNYQTFLIDRHLNLEQALDRLRNEFWFAGTQERFDESLLVLQDQFRKLEKNFHISYVSRNVRRMKNLFFQSIFYHSNSTTEHIAEQNVLDQLQEKNLLDQRLYEEANHLLNEKIERYSGDFESDLMRLRRQ